MHLGHTYSAFGHGATAVIFFLSSSSSSSSCFFLSRSLLPVFRLSPLLFAGDKNKNERARAREREKVRESARFGASRGKHSSNFMHPPRYCATRAVETRWLRFSGFRCNTRERSTLVMYGRLWLTDLFHWKFRRCFVLIVDKKRRIH